MPTAPWLNDDVMPHIARMTNVKELMIDGTGITDTGFELITSMSSLREVWITNTLLTDRSLKTLTSLPNLSELTFYPHEMTNDGLSHLPQITQLRSICIAGVDDGGAKHITDEGLKHLHPMTDLETFTYVDELGVTEQGITDLKAALPDCDISNLDDF